MQSEMATKRVNCPFCGRPAFPAPGGFLEIGEYDGKQYSVEGSVDGYQCPNGHGFYAWPDGKAVAGLPRYASEEPEVMAKEVREGTEAGVSMPVLQMKPVFDSPYEQYRDRNGQVFVLVREITEPDASHDAEVLPVYVIRFPDGVEIEAWPEEILQEA